MPTTEDLTRAEIEAVNEGAGIFRDRMVRLRDFLSESESNTEGLEQALTNAIDYVETNLPRIIRKSREKMDFDDNLSASKIKESSIE